MTMLALIAVLTVTATEELDAACVLVASRMMEAIVAQAEADARPLKPGAETVQGRAALINRMAAGMDPAACALMAAAPDSFFAAMALDMARPQPAIAP